MSKGKTPDKIMSVALYIAFKSEGPIVKSYIPGNKRAKRGSVRWRLRANLVEVAHRRPVGGLRRRRDHGHELGGVLPMGCRTSKCRTSRTRAALATKSELARPCIDPFGHV
jgi:hypothetical protein